MDVCAPNQIGHGLRCRSVHNRTGSQNLRVLDFFVLTMFGFVLTVLGEIVLSDVCCGFDVLCKGFGHVLSQRLRTYHMF